MICKLSTFQTFKDYRCVSSLNLALTNSAFYKIPLPILEFSTIVPACHIQPLIVSIPQGTQSSEITTACDGMSEFMNHELDIHLYVQRTVCICMYIAQICMYVVNQMYTSLCIAVIFTMHYLVIFSLHRLHPTTSCLHCTEILCSASLCVFVMLPKIFPACVYNSNLHEHVRVICHTQMCTWFTCTCTLSSLHQD